jgi:hypothetical protein
MGLQIAITTLFPYASSKVFTEEIDNRLNKEDLLSPMGHAFSNLLKA